MLVREESVLVMKYIFANEDFKDSLFNFNEGEKYEVLSEEDDAYVFESDKGYADQISKNYLKDQRQLSIVESN